MNTLLQGGTLLLALLAAAPAGTEPFVLKGKLGPKADVTKVYLAYSLDKTSVLDSATVRNGAFEFKGAPSEPVRATLKFAHKGVGSVYKTQDATEVYLEKGTISVSSSDSARHATIAGTPLNVENTKLQAALKPLNDKLNLLLKEWRSTPAEKKSDAAFQAGFDARYDPVEADIKKQQAAYIKANPGHRFSLFVLQKFGGVIPKVDEYAALYNGLTPTVRATAYGVRVAEQIKRLQKTAIGAIAPDFTQNDPSGKPVSLKSLRGKYVLIDFWASWCGPCRMENPNVVRAYNAFKDQGFSILGVSLDKQSAREAWLKAIDKDGLVWTQVSDLQGWQNAAAQEYNVQAIPQNFLIDPQGKIVAANLRGEELHDTLSRLLKKSN